MQYVTRSAEGTEMMAQEFIEYLKSRAGMQGTATIVGLSGELGAGKTTFMKGVARSFNLDAHITSPTFVIQKLYELEDEQFDRLIHIDAYRLEGGEELAPLGWYEMLSDPKNIIFVEWPEKVFDAMPMRAEMIHFQVLDTNERGITYGEEFDFTVPDPIG